MSCEAFEDLLGLAAGGDLAGEDLRILEDHLARCEACRALKEDLDRSRLALLAFGQVEVPAGMETDLTARVMRAVAREPRTAYGRRGWRPVYAWATAASFLLAILGLILAVQGHRSPSPGAQSGRLALVTQAPPRTSAGDGGHPEMRGPAHPGCSVPEPRPETSRATVALASKPRPAGPRADATTHDELRQPLVIRLQTEDPSVLIYWIVPAQGGNA